MIRDRNDHGFDPTRDKSRARREEAPQAQNTSDRYEHYMKEAARNKSIT